MFGAICVMLDTVFNISESRKVNKKVEDYKAQRTRDKEHLEMKLKEREKFFQNI
jgi:hypothetical protein